MCKFSANFVFDKTMNGQTYKTRNVVNTYDYLILNVTFEDNFSNAPTHAKIEFKNDESEKEVTRQRWIWHEQKKNDEKKEWRAEREGQGEQKTNHELWNLTIF